MEKCREVTGHRPTENFCFLPRAHSLCHVMCNSFHNRGAISNCGLILWLDLHNRIESSGRVAVPSLGLKKHCFWSFLPLLWASPVRKPCIGESSDPNRRIDRGYRTEVSTHLLRDQPNELMGYSHPAFEWASQSHQRCSLIIPKYEQWALTLCIEASSCLLHCTVETIHN